MGRPKKTTEAVAEKKEVVLTEMQQKIWDEIKDIAVEYFAIPDQTIGTICKPLNMLPDVLYVELKGSAAIRSIETALDQQTVKIEGKKVPVFIVEQQDKYTLIRQNVTSL